MNSRLHTTTLTVLAAFALTIASSFADTLTWSAGSGTWTNGGAGNFGDTWDNSVPDSAVFTGTANTTYTVAIVGSIDILDLDFNTTGATQNNSSKYLIDGGTLNFASGGNISTNRNDIDHTITSTITGSPTVSITDWNPGANNQYEGIVFAPGAGQSQTLGAVSMPDNTGTGDKAGVALGGSTTGNTVASIAYAGGDRYGTVYVNGTSTSEWTTGNITTGTLRVSSGTLIVNGTANAGYNGILLTGGTVGGNGTLTNNDRRTELLVNNGVTLAPGTSVGTITVSWGTANNPTPSRTDWSLQMLDGSIYEWEIAGPGSTDTIHLTDGKLYVDDMTVKIVDLGSDIFDLGTELTLFTYDAGVTVDLSGFGNNFDTSGLSSKWIVDTLSLTDDGNGTIYMTGLAKIPEPSTAILAVLGIAGVCVRRRRFA